MNDITDVKWKSGYKLGDQQNLYLQIRGGVGGSPGYLLC